MTAQCICFSPRRQAATLGAWQASPLFALLVVLPPALLICCIQTVVQLVWLMRNKV